MAETTGKKDKEKKRRMKRQEKEQKMEDRKANSTKGKSLDDMMAYVDEYGRITSTPPDPMKKKIVINVDDIQLGAAKIEEINPADLIRNGVISFFNDSKGYGFIRDLDTKESVFVHMNGLLDSVKENDKVTFEVERGPKGLNAIKVKLAK
jgi:cold shock CspA family protein